MLQRAGNVRKSVTSVGLDGIGYFSCYCVSPLHKRMNKCQEIEMRKSVYA